MTTAPAEPDPNTEPDIHPSSVPPQSPEPEPTGPDGLPEPEPSGPGTES